MKVRNRLHSCLPRAAKAVLPALVGVSALGFALPGTAGASPATYTAQAQASGLDINLFGTQLTGGAASASVNSGTPSADAEGVGTLTPGLVEDQKASASGTTQTQNLPKACAQGGAAPASSPVGLTIGLACSSAVATVANGVPSASATGEIAGVDLNVSSLLDQIISSGGNQLFSGLQQVLGQLNGTPLGTGTTACPDPNASSTGSTSTGSSTTTSTTTAANPLSSLLGTASVPGTPLNTLIGSLGLSSTPVASSTGPLGNLLQGLCQTLTNVENVVKGANAPSTLVVRIGPAAASVIGTAANTAQATAEGATAEVQILPEVGCDASSLVACITNPLGYAVPLIDIKVAPAQSLDSWDGTNWTPSTKSALATVALNIPGYAQTISVNPGQHLDLLAGTPLETVIDLGSATTSAADTSNGSDTANGGTLDLVKGINGGIMLDLGSSSVLGRDKAATVTAARVSPPVRSNPPTARVAPEAAPPAVAPVPTATLVHTGAWWSGSMPYIGGVAALGGLLLAWPRLRRTMRLGTLLRAARR